MTVVEVTCTYCGHVWKDFVYSQKYFESGNCCIKCKDKSLKYRDPSKNKVDYYQGDNEKGEGSNS